MEFEFWFQKTQLLLNRLPETKRYLYDKIDWSQRCLGILGSRGTGKTTMILQHMKDIYDASDKALYIPLDHPGFHAMDLYEFAERFFQYGGRLLAFDEVHKYPQWATHIKAIYDGYPELKIIFSGSSLLRVSRQKADLSRRAVIYHLHGMSFREYLNFSLSLDFQPVSIKEITENHTVIVADVQKKIRPLEHFSRFQKNGYYPFFLESSELYHARLGEVISHILEVDLPQVNNIKTDSITKIKKLLYMLAVSVPSELNINKLSAIIGASRQVVYDYMEYLKNARLFNIVRMSGGGYRIINKTEKILLENTNLFYALSPDVNMGAVRESFFVNQVLNSLSYHPQVLEKGIQLSKSGDFVVNEEYIFEIGGKNKSATQIKGLDRAYIVSDGINTGFGNKIPLWLFGFLY